jgi:hypothetical protein
VHWGVACLYVGGVEEGVVVEYQRGWGGGSD